MAGEDRRSVATAFQPPSLRERVRVIQGELNGAGLNSRIFEAQIFEAFRSPPRPRAMATALAAAAALTSRHRRSGTSRT
jgi:hypothetical protein